LYDNLGKDEALAIRVDRAVIDSRMDDWRGNPFKAKQVKLAIKTALGSDEALAERIFELVKNQYEY
jgi:type I restriction enzyme R subunit